jgi:integrase
VPLSPEAIFFAQETFKIFPDVEQFIATDKGSYVTPSILYKQFNKILIRAGLSPRGIHTLRHTFVSMLFDHGLDTVTIASIIGDTESTVSKTYLHIFQERKAAAIDRINFVTPLTDNDVQNNYGVENNPLEFMDSITDEVE